MRGMRRALLAAMVTACAVAAVAVAEDSVIPRITKFNVTPRRVCRTCSSNVVTFTFKLSEFAQVRAATSPIDPPKGPIVLFKRNFRAGVHTRRFSVQGFQTGKWQLQLTAIDKSNNASHPATRTYRVVK